MKKLKTILCVLLSSMFLLFAGACNNTYDNGASQYYEDTTSNEFVNFSIYTDKTVGYGDKALVKIQYCIEVKKDFTLKSAYAKEVTDLIFVVGLNDKHDTEYYKQNPLVVDGIERDNILNGVGLLTTGGGMSVEFDCKVGDTYTRTFYMQRYHVKNEIISAVASAGKYRLHLEIHSLSTRAVIVDGEVQEEARKGEYFLIPTDIVLDMQ